MSETIKDQETSSEQGNAGRRRLVRGAMALAPLVLTLRSGAAAASCTGALTLGVALDPSNNKIPDTVLGVKEGDICFRVGKLPSCPTSPDKVLTTPENLALEHTTVSNSLRCGSGQNVWTGNVAILSSGAVASFMPK